MVCGGDYWDDSDDSDGGQVLAASSSSGVSTRATQVFSKSSSLHKTCDPSQWKEDMLVCEHENPVIVAMDVTGSMGNWTKILYDKLPMFYGQIMMQKYLQEPSLSFCANGDAQYDKAPLQITEFAQGATLKQLISKMYLEGGGGGNGKESYGLGAYFYLNRCDISKAKDPYIFFTGDESFYDKVSADWIRKHIEITVSESLDCRTVFRQLKEKFKDNLFLLKKPYYSLSADHQIKKNWIELLGEENVILFKTPKAVVDIMLGIMAIRSGCRTLEKYLDDLKERGQDNARILEVKTALSKVKVNPKRSSKIDVSAFDAPGEEEGEGED